MAAGMLFYALFICLVAAITDIREGKVYNRFLGYSLLPGSIAVVIYYGINSEQRSLFAMNMISAIVIALLFYALKVWGAGDAKLWLALNLLFPAQKYWIINDMIFPSMIILMIIFIEGYVYIILETVILFLKKSPTISNFDLNPKKIKLEDIWNWIFTITILSILYQILSYYTGDYFEANRIFFSLFGVLFAGNLFQIRFRGKKIITIVSLIIYNSIGIIKGQTFEYENYINTAIIVIISMITKRFTEKYNYSIIPIKNVKEGMILSYFTVQQFSMSRIKELPHFTDETTRSRISSVQADAVKRWEKSKFGAESIIVVRHIPFAVFIFLGTLTYVIGVQIWLI